MSASPRRQPWLRRLRARVGDALVVGRDRAALAGRDDLARMEAEAAEQPERSARAPAAPRAERAGRVLEQRQVGQLLEPRGPAEEVHGDDRLRARPDLDLRRSRGSSSPGRRRRAPASARRARRRSPSPGRCRRARAPRRPAAARARAPRDGAPPSRTRPRPRARPRTRARARASNSAHERAHRELPALEHLAHRVELVARRRRAG